jgi:hypothetical protein
MVGTTADKLDWPCAGCDRSIWHPLFTSDEEAQNQDMLRPMLWCLLLLSSLQTYAAEAAGFVRLEEGSRFSAEYVHFEPMNGTTLEKKLLLKFRKRATGNLSTTGLRFR